MKACLECGKWPGKDFFCGDREDSPSSGLRDVKKIHGYLEPQYLDTQRVSHHALPFNNSSGLHLSWLSVNKWAVSHFIPWGRDCSSSILIGPMRLREARSPVQCHEETNLVLNFTLTIFPLLHNVQLGSTLIVIVYEFFLCSGLGASHRLAQLNLIAVSIFQMWKLRMLSMVFWLY